MSSKIRYVLQYEGSYLAGHNVFKYLRQRGLECKGFKATIDTARLIKAKLWAFREPRNLRVSRSRYKSFCKKYGINHPRPKFVADYEDGPELPQALGGIHAGVNQTQRPSRIAQRRQNALRNP